MARRPIPTAANTSTIYRVGTPTPTPDCPNPAPRIYSIQAVIMPRRVTVLWNTGSPEDKAVFKDEYMDPADADGTIEDAWNRYLDDLDRAAEANRRALAKYDVDYKAACQARWGTDVPPEPTE